jgi:hypothetical protein
MNNTEARSAILYYRGDTLVRRAVNAIPTESVADALATAASHVWEEAAEQVFVGVPVTMQEAAWGTSLEFTSPIGPVKMVGTALLNR